MKKLIFGFLIFILLLILSVSGYLFAKPKVVVRNLTDSDIKEFKIKLPSSRIAIGPIAPGEVEVVYFSFQQVSGEAKYSAYHDELSTITGVIHYDSSGQLFRKVEFTFESDGNVNIQVRE